MLQYLDYFLDIFHIFIIIFNTTGWVFIPTRKYHFVLINITILSWLGGGFFYGLGYCFLTDLQWYIKNNLDELNLPNSYIDYILRRFFSISMNPTTIDIMTAIFFIILFFIAWGFFLKSLFNNTAK